MSSPSVLQVFVFRSGQYVGSEIFPEPEIVIGSSDGADLHIDDEGVAPNHAILNNKEGKATLLDLGASGGTRVNRVPIQHCYVTARDEIQVGSFTLKIKFVQARAEASSSSAPAPAPAPAAPAARGGIDDLIPDSLGAAAPDDALDVTGQDVLESVDMPAARGMPEFGNLDDALASAFMSPEEQSTSTAPEPARSIPEVAHDLSTAAPRSSVPRAPSEPAADPLAAFGPPTAQPTAEPTSIPEHAFDVPTVRAPPPESPATSAAAVDQQLVRELHLDIHTTSDRAPTPEPAAEPSGFAPVAPAAPYVDDEEELDEDEREELIPPGFSLVEKLISEGVARPGKAAVEVLSFTPEAVHSASLLSKKGERLVLGRRIQSQPIPPAGHKGLPLVRVLEPGRAEIMLPDDAEGFSSRNRERIPLDQLRSQARPAGRKKAAKIIELRAGSQLTLSLGETGFFIRFVDPPPVPVEAKRFQVDQHIRNSFGGAIVAHLLAGLIVGMSAEGVSYSDTMVAEWTEIPQEDIRDVEIEEPEPEPEPVEEPEPEPEPEPEAEPPPEPPEPQRRRTPPPKRAKPARGPKGVSKERVKNAGVLGAMGKLNMAAPGKKSMVQAVSNIDAVKTPGGSNYRVGALVGKTPSSKVQVGGGGGGKLLTRGSAELLKGGTGFARIGKKTGDAKVRGKVSKASARRMQSQGSLPREAIAKVINEHLSEVQYCYEKNLLKDPSIKGKLTVEWTIQMNGSVGRVRQKSSSLSSPAVAGCIMQSIKRWRFPRPSGGVVVVSYPFIFSQTSF
mgnify:CR=1 FL=1